MRSRLLRAITVAALSATLSVSAAITCGCSSRAATPDIAPHLAESGETAPVRAIDSRESAVLSAIDGELDPAEYRERVNELYSIVVYDKKKPIFAPDDPVEPIYTAARSVLDKYVLNSWHDDADGEYNIVHTVHDYLVCNVSYDFALFDSYNSGNTDLENDPAFFIDGVFLNGRAVCDGISRAFDFLCAIDGVDSFRVTGSFAASPHAWNKVKIDGEWYNVDATADAAYYVGADGKYRKQLSHGFFLMSDKTLAEFENGHTFERQPFIAAIDRGYYDKGDKTIAIGDAEYSAIVGSQAELNALFSAVENSNGGVGKIEVKLDFPNKTQINNIDMYASEIKAAYASIESDFDISASSPYFRYPNGVYLFLIYK